MAEGFERSFPDQYMLRLPEGMRDRLKALAKANKRSMNAEIVQALDTWLNRNPEELKVDLAPGENVMILGQAVAEAIMANPDIQKLLNGRLTTLSPVIDTRRHEKGDA